MFSARNYPKLATKKFEKRNSIQTFIIIIIFFLQIQAYTLFGKFLLCGKDLETFQDWIQTQCGANAHQAKTAAQALSDWAEAFI